MMLVQCRIQPSSIEGLGCFAAQDIVLGQSVWTFDPRFDVVLDPKVIPTFPPNIRAAIDRYAFIDDQERVVFCADEGKYFNHADDPNTRKDPSGTTWIACRFIKAGEEITCDYGELKPVDII